MSASHQFCTFHVGGLFLGVDVLHVQEVMRQRELATVPLAPATVEGLLNLRGQIVTAIDLRRRLGCPARAADEVPMFMIVRTDDGFTALLVDAVGDVLEVDPESFEPAPDTLPAATRALISGVHKLPGRLLHVLDAAQAATLPAHAA
ncbi:MAG: chemotaxis protein CheW [Verrucomicrobia bacterium]|nr:chemotaxis protein CheW [Verrucomicrobiota bacterium]